VANDRIEFLDALRGVAILGILPVNAAFFAYPATVAAEPAYGGSPAAAHAVRFLFEGKFHTIFALLFGVGMAVLWKRAGETGRRWGPLVARRLGLLFVLGCAHALLLWYGDIVACYAFLGLALCWTPGRSPGSLRRWGAVLIALPLPLLGIGMALLVPGMVVELPDGRHGAWSPGSWSGFGGELARFDPDFEIAVYRDGSFAEATALRGTTWAAWTVLEFPLWGPRVAGLFLVGMALAREGWFLAPGSEEGRRRFGRMLRWGLAAGIPLTVLDLVLRLSAPGDTAARIGAEAANYVGSLGLGAAYVALVARACAARPGAAAIRAFAAAGRMAFSNYLVQSAAMTLVFYGSGLGFFAAVDRRTLLAIAAALALTQVAGSVLWLRRFRMGPVEWAWRAFTYLRAPR
jgi:uncharacterized protein